MADSIEEYHNKLSPADQKDFSDTYMNVARTDGAKIEQEKCMPTAASNAADLAIAAWQIMKGVTKNGSVLDQTFGGPMPNPYEMAKIDRVSSCLRENIGNEAIKQFEKKKH